MRAAEVALTEQDRATLRSWLASGKTERRVAFRAEVVLALAEGLSNGTVAERLGTRAATVSKWRGRFAYKGLSGLSDAPRSGKPRHYAAEDERRVLTALDTPPPGYARWDGTLLARELVRHHQEPDLARAAPPRDFARAATQLVHQHRSRLHPEGGGRCRAVFANHRRTRCCC